MPAAHEVGELADTVELYDWKSVEGTGFAFEHPTTAGFSRSLRYALETYRHREAWHVLRLDGMRRDFFLAPPGEGVREAPRLGQRAGL